MRYGKNADRFRVDDEDERGAIFGHVGYGFGCHLAHVAQVHEDDGARRYAWQVVDEHGYDAISFIILFYFWLKNIYKWNENIIYI